MRCKSLLLATVSSLAIIGAVHVAAAADLPARAPVPVKAPIVAAAYNWTGFYIGIHGGGAWLDHNQRTVREQWHLQLRRRWRRRVLRTVV